MKDTKYPCPICDKSITFVTFTFFNKCQCGSWLVYDAVGDVWVGMWANECFLLPNDYMLILYINTSKDNNWMLFETGSQTTICKGQDAYNFWPFKDKEAMRDKIDNFLFWW